MSFKDNFSKQASLYAEFRPHYPQEMINFISNLCTSHELAWDAGTGNGQAAIALTKYFNHVVATDPSSEQIKNAVPDNKVIYKVQRSEECELEANSVDLITIANALHWFNFDTFYAIANNVLKKDGIIAAWCYTLPTINDVIDELVSTFHNVTVDEFWVHENRLVEKEYQTIPFPFEEISTPQFYSEKEFTLPDFISYLNTWSATQKYIQKYDSNPTDILSEEMKKVWGNVHDKKTVKWKLTLKVGKKLSH